MSFLKFLMISFLAAGIAACSPFKSSTSVEEFVKYASVEIEKPGCSGILISGNEILTAAHCTDSGKLHTFRVNIQGSWYTAYLKKYDVAKDLALLVIPGVSFSHPAIFAEEGGRLTDSVFIVGNPRTILPDTVTSGIISYLERQTKDDTRPRTQINGDGAPGNSGGAILNTQGEVIGVLIAGFFLSMSEFAGQYILAVTLEDVKEFLNERS